MDRDEELRARAEEILYEFKKRSILNHGLNVKDDVLFDQISEVIQEKIFEYIKSSFRDYNFQQLSEIYEILSESVEMDQAQKEVKQQKKSALN